MSEPKKCAHCGKEFEKPKSLAYWQWEKQRFCSQACSGLSRSAEKCEYKRTNNSGKKRPLHRVLVEQKIGRPLLDREVVHHKNGDKHDNRIENLEVMDVGEHGRLHHLKHDLVKTCVVCGKQYEPSKTKRKTSKTCGYDCKIKLLTRLNKERALAAQKQ